MSEPVPDPARTAVDAEAPGRPGERTLPEHSLRREALLGRAFSRLATFSLRLLVIAAAVVLVGYAVGRLWVIVLPVLLGLLLATVFWPPVRVLRRRGVRPALAAGGTLVIGVLLLLALVTALAPQVTGQAEEIADQVVAGLDDLQDLVTGPPLNLGEEAIGGAIDNVITELQANARQIAGRVISGAVAAGSLLLTALLAVVLCFFFLKDGPRFLPWLGGLVGPRAAPHVEAVGQRAWTTLSGFIKAQAAVGLVDAVAIGVGLALLGVPLALPLAVLIFFGAFIPIIGAVVTGALAALVALVTNGPTSALVVVGLVLLVQQLEGNVLQPILVGRTLQLHPAVVILAVTAGGTLAGITGAFLAVPVVAVAAVAVRYGRQQLAELEPGPGTPPAAAGTPSGPPDAPETA
ncbi:MAG TPA: AI-2E family transporter [Mycobacteriales bacterium]|nr:AI-2E family transporter [Mycobacteriales bacterium]